LAAKENNMIYAKDLLILRDGQVLSGKVLKNEFKIKTSFGDVTVNKEQIVNLYFVHPEGTGFPSADQIRTSAGDDIKGKLVQTQTISFVLASNSQTERIPRDKINALIFLESQD